MTEENHNPSMRKANKITLRLHPSFPLSQPDQLKII